ncbi:MAG: hypothetical protein ACRELA_01285 [Candidatus Rokuibacteriota bacterium]
MARDAFRIVAVMGLLLAATAAGAAEAPPGPLEEHASAVSGIARSTAVGDAYVLGRLSRELGIPVATLQDERELTRLEWGDLLVAHRLAENSGATFEELVEEFRSGRRWQEIAQEHEVDLEAVVAQVKAAREAIEREAPRPSTPAAQPKKPSQKGGKAPKPGTGKGDGLRGKQAR